MAGVSKKFGINFYKPRNKKRSLETKDELDADAYRKGSWGNLSPNMSVGMPIKSSKSNSMGSINSEACDNSLDHEEIMSLTHTVRSFSEALTKLKSTFCPEPSATPTPEEMRVDAFERLGEVLNILKGVLQKYPALHTTDVLTSAAVLISKIKSSQYEDGTELLYHIDQLALAFSSSVSEYLMGDTDICPSLGKAKSHDNLLAAHGEFNGDERMSNNSAYSGEEIDSILQRLDGGIDMALQRAKAWAKYAKEVINYVEKRANLEAEFSKSLAKLAQTVRQSVTEETFQPFQSIYFTALDQDTDFSHTCQATCALIQSQKFIEPLSTRRSDHEKARKNLKDSWTRELKKMHEAVGNLKKSKSVYITRQQEYEKAKEVAGKAESENLGQSGAGQQKAEKKRKQEEDAMHRAMEAETSYKSCIMEANHRQRELEKVKTDILGKIRELILESDEIMKMVTVGYFQLLHSVTAPAPVQFQALWESAQQYDPGSQYAEYVRRLPGPPPDTNNNPFMFEPYAPDYKPFEARKPSSHSSGSGSYEILSSQLDESPSARYDMKSHLKAWAAGEEDTDSISGSSSKSLESSPSASPYQPHRKPLGSHTASFADVLDADSKVSESNFHQSATFSGVSLSQSAQTHTFRKLRTPSKCRECESYVYFQGAECEKCGLSSHKKCLETLRWECGHKPLQRRMTTFGVDFSAHVKETHTDIPLLVSACIAEINAKGINVQGIYRKSGVKSKVERLCQQFENGEECDIDLSEHHPNVIANVLKLYLRQLPEPLLTFKLYPELITLAKDEQAGLVSQPEEPDALQRLIMLVNVLPLANFRTCGLLMHHLKRVTAHKENNQMTASNLGIVFGPTLLRPKEGAASLNSLIETPHQTRIIELLIQNVEGVFGAEDMFMVVEDTPVEVLGATELDKTSQEPEGAEGGTDLPSPAATSGETRWFVPTITESLLDELAKEDPGFQKLLDCSKKDQSIDRYGMAQEDSAMLPGSTVSNTEVVKPDDGVSAPAVVAEECEDEAQHSAHTDWDDSEDLPDSLLPDDSVPVQSVVIAPVNSSPNFISTPSEISSHSASILNAPATHQKLVASLSAEERCSRSNSPGLRKKLLPSQVISRSSPVVTSRLCTGSPEEGGGEREGGPVNLTTPRPYSPPATQLRTVTAPRAGPSLTRPGKPDVVGSGSHGTRPAERGRATPPPDNRTAAASKSTFYVKAPAGDHRAARRSNSGPATTADTVGEEEAGNSAPVALHSGRNSPALHGSLAGSTGALSVASSSSSGSSRPRSPSLVPMDKRREPRYV